MSERENSTALVPVESEYQLELREFDAAGKSNKFMIPVPKDVNPQQLGVMLRVGVLKRTTWKNYDVPTILLAVLYADRMGLDILAGDVYQAVEGRLNTTAGAKIRHAIASGRVEGYKVDITEGDKVELPWETGKSQGTWKGPNYKAVVTVYVKGWREPMVYETTLKEWFTGRNPNWRDRPLYMLRKNALSKALEEVAPLGTEGDEAPPLVVDTNQAEAAAKKALAEAKVEAINEKGEK